MKECRLCPRNCKVDRRDTKGICGAGSKIRIARAALHYMEEPCISGKNGSGTIFFSGCNLKCCFCQNYRLSHEMYGKDISVERLSEIFLELQDKGANNINLVTAVPYIPWIVDALDQVKSQLHIPIVYNCGGYESPETIQMLKGYVDIYLHDIKYFDSELSLKYSASADYFKYASKSTLEMIKQLGKPQFITNSNGEKLLNKGVIIRHLVLPGARKDSIKILNWLAQNVSPDAYLISIMSQYTPCYKSNKHKEINRLVTSFEYNSVIDEAIRLGITQGYMQRKSSVGTEYTPDFNLEGC